jgi:hypothetical protein
MLEALKEFNEDWWSTPIHPTPTPFVLPIAEHTMALTISLSSTRISVLLLSLLKM